MKSKKNLLKIRKKLFAEFKRIGPFMEGSLSTVNRICGNKNCKCRKYHNKKHPSVFLTWKEKKITKAIYVLVTKHHEAESWSQNYKKLKILIKQISNIQKELLKLR